MKALSIENLTKTYANGNQALKGINFSVDAGDLYALLGPNGAGKTTAIGIITALVNKTGGKVEIFGHTSVAIVTGRPRFSQGSPCLSNFGLA